MSSGYERYINYYYYNNYYYYYVLMKNKLNKLQHIDIS